MRMGMLRTVRVYAFKVSARGSSFAGFTSSAAPPPAGAETKPAFTSELNNEVKFGTDGVDTGVGAEAVAGGPAGLNGYVAGGGAA